MRTLLIQCHLALQLDELFLKVVSHRSRYTFYGGLHIRHHWKNWIDQLGRSMGLTINKSIPNFRIMIWYQEQPIAPHLPTLYTWRYASCTLWSLMMRWAPEGEVTLFCSHFLPDDIILNSWLAQHGTNHLCCNLLPSHSSFLSTSPSLSMIISNKPSNNQQSNKKNVAWNYEVKQNYDASKTLSHCFNLPPSLSSSLSTTPSPSMININKVTKKTPPETMKWSKATKPSTATKPCRTTKPNKTTKVSNSSHHIVLICCHLSLPPSLLPPLCQW